MMAARQSHLVWNPPPIPLSSQGRWILRGGRIVASLCLDMIGVLHLAHTTPFPPDATEIGSKSTRRQGSYR